MTEPESIAVRGRIASRDAPHAGGASMANRPGAREPNVFISYARENTTDRERTVAELERRHIKCLGDWLLTRGAPNYEDELAALIRKADAFMVLLSRQSVESHACQSELRVAESLKKRILPAQIRNDFDAERLPPSLALPQWAYLSNAECFEAEVEKLVVALNTDFALLETHTWLTERAHHWDTRGRARGSLLHGEDLERAETWLPTAAANLLTFPKPTPLQQQFVTMSGHERARSLRARLAAVAVAAVLLAGATVTAVVFWRQAEWRAAIEEGNSVIAEAAAPGRQSEALAHAVRAIENRGPKKALPSEMTRGLSLAVAAGRVLVPRTVNGTSAAVGGTAPGRPSPCLSDTASTASTLATSEDGLLACAKCSNEDARIFSVTTGKVVSTLEGSSNTGIAEFNSARTRLVTVGGFNARGADIVKVWGPETGHCLFDSSVLDWPRSRAVHLSPSGDRLARVHDKYDVTIETFGRETLPKLSNYSDAVYDVRFSPDGSHLLVDAGPGINVFDTRSPARIARITTGQGVAPKLLAFSHDGSMFLTSALRNAQVWRTRTGELLAAFAATDTIVGGTISGDGNEVLLDREGGTRESWGLRPDSASLTLQLSEDYDRLRFAADGGLFGAQSFGGATPEPLPWRPIVNPNGSNEPSVSVAKVRPDVHDRIVAALEALGETVVVLAPSPDGKQVASASQLAPSERIPTSSARGSELRVRSNGTGQIVRIWDAQTAQVVLELVGHSAQVKALAYSADGESLATLAEDREVRIFPASVPSFLARARALLDEQERREAPSGNGTGPATRRTEP